MRRELYVLRDQVAKMIVAGPYLMVNDAVAMRRFADMSQEEPFKSHLGDFALFHVGSIDDESGVVDGVMDVRPVLSGAELRRLQQESVNA